MATSKYFKTLFIPGLYGQHLIWKNEVLPVCNRVDKIISFGNLIGCDEYSKDSLDRGRNQATLTSVNTFRSYFEDWIQLVGPNEIAALNAPRVWTSPTSDTHLRKNWLETPRLFKVASASNGRLQTHGGLSYGEWVSIDSPKTAEEAAQRLNEKYSGTLYQGTAKRLGNAPNFSVNPIWADPITEVYPSWITAEETCPFDQVHSSLDLSNPIGRRLIKNEDSLLYHLDKVQFRTFGSIAKIKTAGFLSIHIPIQGKTINRLPGGRSLYIEQLPLSA